MVTVNTALPPGESLTHHNLNRFVYLFIYFCLYHFYVKKTQTALQIIFSDAIGAVLYIIKNLERFSRCIKYTFWPVLCQFCHIKWKAFSIFLCKQTVKLKEQLLKVLHWGHAHFLTLLWCQNSNLSGVWATFGLNRVSVWAFNSSLQKNFLNLRKWESNL